MHMIVVNLQLHEDALFCRCFFLLFHFAHYFIVSLHTVHRYRLQEEND